MPASQRRRRPAHPGVRKGNYGGDKQVTITVMVRRREGAKPFIDALAVGRLSPSQRTHVSRELFADRYGADPKDVDEVIRQAKGFGLEVVGEPSLDRRTVTFRGRADAIERAFKAKLVEYELNDYASTRYRVPEREVSVPRSIKPLVVGVFGFNTRPRWGGQKDAIVSEKTAPFLSVLQAVKLYRFPGQLTGNGQCIGILSLGGGYRKEDLEAYFAGVGVAMPEVVDVSADGTLNTPDPARGETTLDIEVAGCAAPGAKIAVYFARRDDQGFITALATAVHDRELAPSVISISFGQAEHECAGHVQAVAEQYFADAALLGVTVCVATGDEGSSGLAEPGDGQRNVYFPASSPHVLSCGGTKLQPNGDGRHSEVVWGASSHGATGGGVSDTFALPPWQKTAGVPRLPNPGWRRRVLFHGGPRRGVPDVAGHAAGYEIHREGKAAADGGTSAVAPLWAGLVALLNEGLGRPVGYLNPYLYEEYERGALSDAFNDVSYGTNELWGTPGFDAGPGWDPCTGFGSPNGEALLKALSR